MRGRATDEVTNTEDEQTEGASFSLTYLARGLAPLFFFKFSLGSLLLFVVFPAASSSLVVAYHAINTLARFRKDEFFNPASTLSTCEAKRMIRIVTYEKCERRQRHIKWGIPVIIASSTIGCLHTLQ